MRRSKPATPGQPGRSGRRWQPGTVGRASKTQQPECSQAMSSWVRARNAGVAVAASVFSVLGKCRSIARQAKQAQAHEAAGNDLKAQALRSRIAKQGTTGHVTQADRTARAKELLAQRAAKQAAKAKPSPKAEAKPSDAHLRFLARQKAAKSKEAVKVAVSKRSTRAVVQSANVKRIADVAAEMSEANSKTRTGRVRIGDLREKFPRMSKEQFDKHLLAAVSSGRHGMALYHADHPAERRAEDEIRTPSGEKRHFVYAGGRMRTHDKPRKPRRGGRAGS